AAQPECRREYLGRLCGAGEHGPPYGSRDVRQASQDVAAVLEAAGSEGRVASEQRRESEGHGLDAAGAKDERRGDAADSPLDDLMSRKRISRVPGRDAMPAPRRARLDEPEAVVRCRRAWWRCPHLRGGQPVPAQRARELDRI